MSGVGTGPPAYDAAIIRTAGLIAFSACQWEGCGAICTDEWGREHCSQDARLHLRLLGVSCSGKAQRKYVRQL